MLVSIVMPAFNAEAYIGSAIASALQQSERRLEVLVIDDGSTDRTGEIAQAAAAADERVRYVRMEVNGGPAAARNRALGMARGDWIALLDADDRFHPRRLELLISLGERAGADIVSDNLIMCPDGGDQPDTLMIPHEQLAQETQLSTAAFIEGNIGSRKNPRCSYGFMQPLFRREFLEAHGLIYDERNRFAEDFLFYVECLARGARWWVTPEPMYYYTIRKGSLTEQQSSADLMRLRNATRQLLADPQTALDPALTRALQRHSRKIDRSYYYRAFTDAMKGRQFDLAARLLFESGDSLNHVIRESASQAPVILRKAMRGGYWRSRSSGLEAVERVRDFGRSIS
ncbi:MAG: glycosyltransferase family 2 protein [Acetobacteraceae bacterium]|nr:glycosyltransferase family 2 protein [Acetobacteraceae bacterium]